MMGLLESGNRVLLSKSDNPKRKLAYTWEFVRIASTWVGINTIRANWIVYEALVNEEIAELSGYHEIKKEVAWAPNSRFDFLLTNGQQRCFVEVKNVTLAEKDLALFPDAKTERGTKHLHHLIEVVEHGMRAVMCFLVQREDCHYFKPAAAIDPTYAAALREAYENGVEVLVYRTKINPPEVLIEGSLDFEL